jgi:hypothetical protein
MHIIKHMFFLKKKKIKVKRNSRKEMKLKYLHMILRVFRSSKSGVCSGLGGGAAEIHGELYIFQILDLAVAAFKTHYIFGQRFHKPFRVLWGKDDPGFYLALGRTRHHIHKINHKFRMGMRDDCKIRILTFCHFLTDLYI